MLFKSSDGALFVQTDGPNTRPYFVGCVDVDTLTEPGGAIDTLIRCFDPDGGWKTLDYTLSAPDPVTTSITALVEESMNYLERVRAGRPATLFIHQRDQGRPDTFGNYKRTWVLNNAIIGEKGASNLAMREEDTQAEMTFGISALPPMYRIFEKLVTRQTVSVTESINNVRFVPSTVYGPATYGYATADAVAGSPADKGDVLYTTDGGATWTVMTAKPFAGAENIVGLAAFAIGRSTTRVIVGRGSTDAGNPAEIAYTDDNGATWTTVNVGSVTAQYFRTHGIFALDPYNIWAVSDGGYIYKSNDAGVTWTARQAGVVTTNVLHCVHFVTDRIGFAGGAGDKVLKTIDGGASWELATATGNGGDILDLYVIDADHVWACTDDGELFYTTDGGTTWSERIYGSVSGSGQCRAITFAPGSALFGVMLHQTAGPVGKVFVTIDGGYNWEGLTTFTNAGLNDVYACDPNTFYIAGEISTTGVIGKIQTR